jgi:carbonic anhydrase
LKELKQYFLSAKEACMNRNVLISFFSLIVLTLVVLNACAPASTPAASPVTIHWTYEGEEGPGHWGDLSPEYAACSTGKSQSPIDISNPAPQDVANLVFHYQPSKVNILNNGHTIQVNYDAGSYLELDGVRYDLLQFHFHAPSEHSINGKLAEAELHLVHQSADGTLAVVGILIDSGAYNPAFQTTFDNLPTTAGPLQQLSAEVDAAAMLPAVQKTYRYDGSLTTPPCSEGVKWNVMVEPIEMSEAQLAAFTHIFEGNNRPLQALEGRSLIEDTTP